MRSPVKRSLMLAIAAAAVLAGVLIAALGGGGHKASAGATARPGTLAGASDYLGVSPAELRRRLRRGESLQQIAGSKPGHSAAGLLAAMLAAEKQRMQQAGVPASVQSARLKRLSVRLAARARRTRARGRSLLAPASAYLGIGEARLEARLAQGGTLAQIATSTPGRSKDGLVEAIADARRQLLARAYADHQITARQEQAALSTLQRRVDEAVARRGG